MVLDLITDDANPHLRLVKMGDPIARYADYNAVARLPIRLCFPDRQKYWQLQKANDLPAIDTIDGGDL